MIPELGLAGHYGVTAPYVLEADESYICRGISFIQSLVDKGVDVYNEYYVPVGVSEEDYNKDLHSVVAIVTLKNKAGIAVNIPSSFISAVPYDVEVPYRRYAVMMEFGLLPNETSFTDLIGKLEETSRINIGLVPQSALVVLPHEGFITKTEHVERESIRETNIRYDTSPRLALEEALKREQQYKQNISALEEALVAANAKIVAPTPP